MTMPTRNRWSSYLTTLAIVAVGLVAVTIPLTPAKAQIGVQVGPFGFGVAPPPPAYVYHPYSPPYPYAYYGQRYYPGYYYGYGYPY